jgi:hypothetical protein
MHLLREKDQLERCVYVFSWQIRFIDVHEDMKLGALS